MNAFPSPKSLLRPAKRSRILLGVAISVATFIHVSTGIEWSEFFHPDELPIAHWLQQSHERGYVSARAYPGGWFVLANLRTHAEAALWNVRRRWRSHAEQAGAVRAIDPDSFSYAPRKRTFQAGDIQRGRDINAWLATFAVLLLYMTALELGASPAAAAFGAVLLGAQPFLLEHAHYCETDGAIPFALCLAGLLSARAIRLRSWGWHLTAMFAAGFAIACKYTLMPLLLWPIGAAIPLAHDAADGRRPRRVAALVASGLAALTLGFLVGTPALCAAPRFFLGSLHRMSLRTYAEGVQALGAAYHDPWTRYGWRASAFAGELARLGALPLALFAVSFGAWFRRDLRRHLGTFPLFLALFPFQAVFLMPWIRNQETLPLLPPLCLGTALAADWAGRAIVRHNSPAPCGDSAPVVAQRRNSLPLPRLAACLILALAVGSLTRSYLDGRRILTSFQRRDTRAECQNWLADCAGEGVSIALDRYVAQSVRGTECGSVDWPLVAEAWPDCLANPERKGKTVGYVLRNTTYTGRRPLKGQSAENVAAFRRDCLPIRSWKISPGIARTATFAQPGIELWALPAPGEESAPDIPAVLDRPVYFTPGMRPLYAAPDPSGVGPLRAVQTVGQRHAFLPVPDAPGWAVSRMVAGPADSAAVAWEDLAQPRRRVLAGRGVALFGFDAAALRRRSAGDARPSTRLRLRNADDQVSICATWPVADRAEAARALRRGGAPAEALTLLREAPELDDAAKTEAFLAAKEAGDAPASDWREAAERTLAALERGIGVLASGGEVRVRGIPLRVLRDFAHIRLFDATLPMADTLPVFLPPGTYRVSLLPPFETTPPTTGLWLQGQVGPATPREDGDGRVWWDASFAMRREALVRTLPEARSADGSPGVDFRRVAIDWDPADQLPRLAEELRAALQ